ncbi:hypothetical protein [Candidatus Palauibacter sp.]|uniref:hypothetical protein n=1 Tax=Candidatus Palauibacter sp. TaxID=3101350 RepID=UPI003B51D3C8
MKRRLLMLFVPVLVATLVAGCGDDNTVDPEPPGVEGPPNLSGTYNLVSLTGAITGGITLAPPIAVGTFTLFQTGVSGDTATGTVSLDLTVTNPLDGSVIPIADTGTFTARADGTWQQTGQMAQNLGTYSLAGTVLTVTVTEPAPNVSTTVWQRQ